MMKNNVIRPFMEVYNLETYIYCSRISDGSYEILINNNPQSTIIKISNVCSTALTLI